MQKIDHVIVVGAGPVGLTLALCLAEADIRVIVLEAEPDVVEDLRASTFHPPTLDLLDQFGISEELIKQGLVCPHWQIRMHPSGERAVFDLSAIAEDTAHPYRLQCEQWKLSRAVLSRLERHPLVKVHFSRRVISVADEGDYASVTVQVAGNDHETQELRAAYVVGCDGARSAVRSSMGVSFEGETYPETTILATTRFPFHEALDGLSNVSYCWKQSGKNFTLLRLPGLWRVSIYPPEDRPIEEALGDASIRLALGDIVPDAATAEVLETRPYRVHQRIASRYRLGRCLLAGDAAHINSPAGGMGMNGGVHDAFNLAEKLTAVMRGSDDNLLDRYERQRLPIARDQIIAQADANRARMRETDPAKRLASLRALQAIVDDRTKLREHLLKTSMITGLRRAAAID